MGQRVRRITIAIERYVEFEGVVRFEFEYVPTSVDDSFVDAVLEKAHQHVEALQLAGGSNPMDDLG